MTDKTVSLAQLALDKNPTEFKQFVYDKLNDKLKTAINTQREVVAGQMFNKPSGNEE